MHSFFMSFSPLFMSRFASIRSRIICLFLWAPFMWEQGSYEAHVFELALCGACLLGYWPFVSESELGFELILTHVTQKRMPRVEVYARAERASQNSTAPTAKAPRVCTFLLQVFLYSKLKQFLTPMPLQKRKLSHCTRHGPLPTPKSRPMLWQVASFR